MEGFGGRGKLIVCNDRTVIELTLPRVLEITISWKEGERQGGKVGVLQGGLGESQTFQVEN